MRFLLLSIPEGKQPRSDDNDQHMGWRVCLQEQLEVWAHVCWKLHRILDDVMDQGVYGGGVEWGLPNKQLIQYDSQAPEICLQRRLHTQSELRPAHQL